MRIPAVAPLVAALAFVASACGLGAPTPPTVTFEPTIVGEVASGQEWLGYDGRYFLDTGDVLDLNAHGVAALPETPRLSLTQLVNVDRARRSKQLLLAGRDLSGRIWYAVATLNRSDACPFTISAGQAFDAGDRLVFSTGLALPKAADFELGPAWLLDLGTREPYPLGEADVICIDRTGTVVRASLAFDY